MKTMTVRDEALALLKEMGVKDDAFANEGIGARSPITGELVGIVRTHAPSEVAAAIGEADAAFKAWRQVPAPRRGEFVRLIGEAWPPRDARSRQDHFRRPRRSARNDRHL
jgi:aldehyde dehydrogenase (NAD+)